MEGNEGECTTKAEKGSKKIPGSGQCMRVYFLTHSKENISLVSVLNRGDFNFYSQ